MQAFALLPYVCINLYGWSRVEGAFTYAVVGCKLDGKAAQISVLWVHLMTSKDP